MAQRSSLKKEITLHPDFIRKNALGAMIVGTVFLVVIIKYLESSAINGI